MLDIEQDTDITDKDSASWEAICSFAEGGDGPDPNSLKLGMTVSADDPWNIRCVEIICNQLTAMITNMEASASDMQDITEGYWKDMIAEKLRRLRVMWRAARRLPGERDEEWEDRMRQKKDEEMASSRRLARRRHVRFCMSKRATHS